MKKVNASLKNNILLENDTGEESVLSGSSSENSSQAILELNYVINPGLSASSVIYDGSLVQDNCPKFVQSFQEIEALLKESKKIVFEFRNSEKMDSAGIQHVQHLVGMLKEAQVDFILAPHTAGIVQKLGEEGYIFDQNSAQDLEMALRQVSFKVTKFSSQQE